MDGVGRSLVLGALLMCGLGVGAGWFGFCCLWGVGLACLDVFCGLPLYGFLRWALWAGGGVVVYVGLGIVLVCWFVCLLLVGGFGF